MPARKRATPQPETTKAPARKPARRRSAKKAAAAKAPAVTGASAAADGAASPQPYEIRIRHFGGGGLQDLTLPVDDRAFYPTVQRWRYVVANRRRITRATRDELSKDLLSWMKVAAHIDSDETLSQRIKDMAAARLVEVSIPFSVETNGWSARLFPWESALWLLTSPYRSETSEFAVVRHLAAGASEGRAAKPRSVLAVESGPGDLGRLYDFSREIDMVEAVLRPISSERLRDPDRGQLVSAIAEHSPSIIHLAGVDPMALESHGLKTAMSSEDQDGFVLRAETDDLMPRARAEPYHLVKPIELAEIVTAGSRKPLLVAISSCYSAQRVAALAVARGAQHAIGFIDTITDADALLFFSVFYRAWAEKWDILEAFLRARREWMDQPDNQGAQRSGVVLWSRSSFVEQVAGRRARAARPSVQGTGSGGATSRDLVFHIGLIKDKAVPGGVRRTASTSLNYSLLHNDRSPFEIFTVEKTTAGPLPLLQVEVVLEVGTEACRCRFSEELPEEPATRDLLDKIRLPLVAGLLRQTSESLRSNLYVKIQCGETVLRESSERVTVLPADEWRDDGEDHRWLPSFVLPRDPAVLNVVSRAQRYLQTLLDDCSAGFDGYQQLAADDSNAAEIVDPQVQAIWAALQHELPISYINPPPSYTSQSQRLRTPTEIFKGNAATCIDLALLFASCLEFVGIYSSVFLIVGHAFPGYWRSDKAWWNMKRFQFDRGDEQTSMRIDENWEEISRRAQSAIPTGQTESWMFTGTDNLEELLGYVQVGSLVPFESTYVTARRGFFEALEQGSSNLHPQSFDAMIDVQSARGENVTPLPLLNGRD